jgi:uncharacterized damage-inducible protein DinB
MEWADARVWAAVPSEDTDDARLLDLFRHAHGVQYSFLTVWTGGDINALFEHTKQLTRLSQLRTWAREYYGQARAFLDTTSVEHLAQPLTVPWAEQVAQYIGRTPKATTLGETVYQVASHSTYHRGQINAQLRTRGVEPPNVDYIAWLWLGRPPAQWQA